MGLFGNANRFYESPLPDNYPTYSMGNRLLNLGYLIGSCYVIALTWNRIFESLIPTTVTTNVQTLNYCATLLSCSLVCYYFINKRYQQHLNPLSYRGKKFILRFLLSVIAINFFTAGTYLMLGIFVPEYAYLIAFGDLVNNYWLTLFKALIVLPLFTQLVFIRYFVGIVGNFTKRGVFIGAFLYGILITIITDNATVGAASIALAFLYGMLFRLQKNFAINLLVNISCNAMLLVNASNQFYRVLNKFTGY